MFYFNLTVAVRFPKASHRILRCKVILMHSYDLMLGSVSFC